MDTLSATSVAPFSSAVARVESSRATFSQRLVSQLKHYAPFFGGVFLLVVFAGLVWKTVEFSYILSSWVVCVWCVIGMSIPLFFGIQLVSNFTKIVKKSPEPEAATICSVEVCINNETVLTVRSWWPLRMSPADVEKHGVRVAMTSGRRWLTENSQPGGKITRIRFDEESATLLCDEYICHKAHVADHCSVCLDDIEASSCIKMKKCGHCFHSDCLSSWFSQSSRLVCPMCRSDHHSLVPQTVILEHTVKEEPTISVLSVSVQEGMLTSAQ